MDKKGVIRDVYITINGRIEYTLIPGGGGYPAATGAKILSIAVSSLETDGLSCVNVGINPILADPENVGRTGLAEYIIDTRKAQCVRQVIPGLQA